MTGTKKSSRSTTSYTDVCAIIDACGRNGVRRFSMNSIVIEFGEPEPAEELQAVDTDANMLDNDTTDSQPETRIEDDSDPETDADLVADALEDLAISDPLAYEEEIRKMAVADNDRD